MTKKERTAGKKIKALPAKTLTSKDAKQVRGGKHIGGVKYDPITLKR